jgi:hypothetical protein
MIEYSQVKKLVKAAISKYIYSKLNSKVTLLIKQHEKKSIFKSFSIQIVNIFLSFICAANLDLKLK